MATRRELLLAATGAAAGMTALAAKDSDAQDHTAEIEIVPLSKNVAAIQRKERDVIAACADGHRMRTMSFAIRGEAGAGACDEGCSKEVLRGIFLAGVLVTRRENHEQSRRGCFKGGWRLVREGITLAYGTLKGTVVAGTHNTPSTTDEDCEPCAPRLHFEGLLEGVAVTERCRGAICASISGTGLDPELAELRMRIEGALSVRCGHH